MTSLAGRTSSFWVGSTGRSSRSAEPVNGRPVVREAVNRGNCVCILGSKKKVRRVRLRAGVRDGRRLGNSVTPTRAEISGSQKVESVNPIPLPRSTRTCVRVALAAPICSGAARRPSREGALFRGAASFLSQSWRLPAGVSRR